MPGVIVNIFSIVVGVVIQSLSTLELTVRRHFCSILKHEVQVLSARSMLPMDTEPLCKVHGPDRSSLGYGEDECAERTAHTTAPGLVFVPPGRSAA